MNGARAVRSCTRQAAQKTEVGGFCSFFETFQRLATLSNNGEPLEGVEAPPGSFRFCAFFSLPWWISSRQLDRREDFLPALIYRGNSAITLSSNPAMFTEAGSVPNVRPWSRMILDVINASAVSELL